MEVVEIGLKKENQSPCIRPTKCPCSFKCTKNYVQPPRVQSMAPERAYNPPLQPFETNTTYHLSYLNVDREHMHHSRSKPIRPNPALAKAEGKFAEETTNKLSYRPVWNMIKTKPILPRHRPMIKSGCMENVTTVRHDFSRKYVQPPEMIKPCKNIRISTGQLDDRTTAKLSYLDPGPTEPAINFKPIRKYCPPSEPIYKETTQKLSFQPFCVKEKEFYSWQQKPIYKRPDAVMCGKTTYAESYLKNEEPCMEKPIRPIGTNILPYGAEFAGKTIYTESYLESSSERVEPIVPSGSISLSNSKMAVDTTSKLSYQAVQTEKRTPIRPRSRNMMGAGPMQSKTTNRSDFIAKVTIRPNLVIPCNNLQSSEAPIEDKTTTKLSYVRPGHVEVAQSFKPVTEYHRSVEKIDSETVSKLSYQPWTPAPKEEMLWISKKKYEPPTDLMSGDTVYHSSYPAPGHYESTCLPVDCDCCDVKNLCPSTAVEDEKKL